MEALSLLEMTPANELSLYRNLCIESFAFFVQHFWDEVPSSEPLEWNWHMELLCKEMEGPAKRVFQGLPVIHDTIFNVPFGTSKSTICSILFQSWTWTYFPRSRHMTGTHTEPLGSDLSSKSKAVIESDKYKHYFPHVVLDKKSDDHFTNTAGGERRICTVGGKTPTGFHAHFLGVDDPIDPKGAMSEAELDNAAQFIERVLPSRKVNKEVAWTYLVMQRLGRGDPSEVMWKAGQKEGAIPVRRVVLPGELSEDVFPPEAKAYYERNGGLLDPKRLSKKVLDNYRSKGAYFYSSQVMQNPMALGGGMFKEHYFNQRVKAAPYHAKRIRYWDRASTADGGCYTAGVLMAFYEGNYYVEHVVHGQWEPDERNKIMRATALRDRTRYGPRNDPEIWVEAEGGSSGRDAWKGVARALAGFRVKEDKVTGAKDTRAEPWSCQCAAGNVYLVEDGTWDIGTYVEEHCLFKPEPGKRLGKFKDQVDGSSGAFNLLTGKGSGPSQIRILFSNSKRKGLKIVVCSRRDLPSVVVEDRPCILITVVDPDPYNNGEERNGFQSDKEQGVGYVAAHSQALNTSQLNSLNEIKDHGNSINGEVDHASNHLAEYKSENHAEGKLPSPQHGLSKLVASVEIQFADISPAEVQDTWNEIVEPWGVTASDLVMKPEHGKKLWAAVVKRRDVPMETIVIADDGDRRAESIAKGICDSLGLKRADTIWFVGDEENQGGTDPGNKHVYDMVKTSRVLVV